MEIIVIAVAVLALVFTLATSYRVVCEMTKTELSEERIDDLANILNQATGRVTKVTGHITTLTSTVSEQGERLADVEKSQDNLTAGVSDLVSNVNRETAELEARFASNEKMGENVITSDNLQAWLENGQLILSTRRGRSTPYTIEEVILHPPDGE